MAPGWHHTIANVIPPSSNSSFNVLPKDIAILMSGNVMMNLFHLITIFYYYYCNVVGLTTKRKGRGLSRGVGLGRLLQPGERIHISFT